MKLVLDIDPVPGNGRNSEGAFIRIPDGSILFAYSKYSSDTAEDDDCCDIAAIYSYDEGETWSEPNTIVKAQSFGVKNIMSVSCIYQKDGSIGVYFLIKELDGTITFGRALSQDGKVFTPERMHHNGNPAYYVMNNDRVERFADGNLYFPAACHLLTDGKNDSFGMTVLFVSEDDGKTLKKLPHYWAISKLDDNGVGLQEPGVIEHKDGSVHIWARTKHDSQYESFSYDGMKTFTPPSPSFWGCPNSPLEFARNEETGVLYAVYNPYGRSLLADKGTSWGRTPLIIRKSMDDGKTWSFPVTVEDAPDRGYCYPAVFFTKDHAMLCSYCRGGKDDYSCLARLGIMKIGLDEI